MMRRTKRRKNSQYLRKMQHPANQSCNACKCLQLCCKLPRAGFAPQDGWRRLTSALETQAQMQSERFPPVLCAVPQIGVEGQLSMSSKSRVLVADSSRIHSQLLSEILGRDSDVEIIPWDFDRTTIVSTAVSQHADILALSSLLDGSVSESVAVIKEMRASAPATRVVVLLDSHQ